jgi:N-acetylglucosaminyl-diphospho-decaprenol L-rhamnosyltransferase
MTPPTVDVVVVNWNSGRLVERCAESLARDDRRDIELASLVVVDNGSSASELPDLSGSPFSAILLRNGSNEGFAAACNRGAAVGAGDFLLFLNPDTRVAPGTLARVALLMAAHPGVGVCGVRTVGEDGKTFRSCARLPRPLHLWNSMLGLDQLAPAIFPGVMLRAWDHAEDCDVDHVIGAFYFIRRSLFERLGGFDERFFVYLEDLDLSARVKQAGMRIRYLASASIEHIGGGASGRDKGARLCHALASRAMYAGKHFGKPHAYALLAGTFTLEFALRIARGVLTLRAGTLAETLRGYRMLLARMPSILRKLA